MIEKQKKISPTISLNLGTILVNRDAWFSFKKMGFDRAAIRDIIIGNGEASLYDFLGELENQSSDSKDNES